MTLETILAAVGLLLMLSGLYWLRNSKRSILLLLLAILSSGVIVYFFPQFMHQVKMTNRTFHTLLLVILGAGFLLLLFNLLRRFLHQRRERQMMHSPGNRMPPSRNMRRHISPPHPSTQAPRPRTPDPRTENGQVPRRLTRYR